MVARLKEGTGQFLEHFNIPGNPQPTIESYPQKNSYKGKQITSPRARLLAKNDRDTRSKAKPLDARQFDTGLRFPSQGRRGGVEVEKKYFMRRKSTPSRNLPPR